MRSFLTEGIVIKRKNFQEADRLITIFSKRNGKLTIKASGVRKITSRRSSHIELLNYCIFSLHETKAFPILTEVESMENFAALKKDLKKIGTSYHICELVDGLCAENQQSEDIFDLLLITLKKIQEGEDINKITYNFELNLLKLLGFYRKDDYSLSVDTQAIIEDILERKLKSKQILGRLS